MVPDAVLADDTAAGEAEGRGDGDWQADRPTASAETTSAVRRGVRVIRLIVSPAVADQMEIRSQTYDEGPGGSSAGALARAAQARASVPR
ncbi:hypothetical protein GCM10011574_31210 [Microbispora bryophytorum]|uniref:Uncharacterized protein n=1 Tax=Microbispora bryophytorum TaxID=1460882 RepID=A0A8H9GZL9_9ACTN|nr:hypothetical protein GCM10011574_31210 [Microbispora bryophytorum]